MNYDKLAATTCEDIKQELIDKEGRIKALKTKVETYVPEPYVVPTDPDKLPEIEFEGLNAGELYQSVDSIKLKIYDSFTFRSTYSLNPIYFKADASTNVKITARFKGSFSTETSAMKFKVTLNNNIVAIMGNDNGEIGAFDVQFDSNVLASSENCGNKLLVSFLGMSSTQILNLDTVELIVEGTNVFFTTEIYDYSVCVINNNYEFTKIDDEGNGFYAVIPVNSFTSLDGITWLPTGYKAPYQDKFSAMMNYGNEYAPEYPIVVVHNFTNKLIIDSFGANEVLQLQPSAYYNHFKTCYTFYNNSKVPLNCFYIASNKYLRKFYVDKITGTFNTAGVSMDKTLDYANLVRVDYPILNYDYVIGREYVILCKDNGTNLFKNAATSGGITDLFVAEVGLGNHITANFIDSLASNCIKVEVYVNVYGKIIKKMIESVSGHWTLTSETVIGNYKKFYKGVGNHYFVITHNNEFKYF